MKAKEILKQSKNNTWTNVNAIIEKSGLTINLIQDLPFMKMWEVENNKEITHIVNTMKYCGQNMASVKFVYNN